MGVRIQRLGLTLVLLASCGFPRPADVGPTDGGGDDGGGDDGGPGATQCQLTAISPSIAKSNATLTLEGTFLGDVTVHFPGSVARPATVLGQHRATVAVPPEASSGDLTVTACDTALGPQPFRHVTFAVSVTRVGGLPDQGNVARPAPRLARARANSTAVVAGRYVYILGGVDSGGALASVEQAAINADGSLTGFSFYAASNLAIARQQHTSVVLGGYVYVLGGAGNGVLDNVERAALARDGTLGEFAVVPGVKLATPRRGHASVVIGGSLYVVGGSNSGPLDSVERAAINADGTLGAFATVAGTHLATARSGHTAVVVGSYLYVVAGTGPAGAVDDVERAPINPDGTLGAFAAVAGVTLPMPRSNHTAVVLDGVLYVFGGAGNAGSLGSIARAAFDADGLLGAFTTLGDAMMTPRQGHATVVIGNYVYTFGGLGATALESTEWAALMGNGELSQPTVSGATFVVPRSEATVAVIDRYVYVVGGSTTSANTVERATVGVDGSLSSFATVDGVSLTTPRRRHTAAVIGKYLYVFGGTGAAGPVKSIERALINADGSLGAFSDAGNLSVVRTLHSTAVIGNAVYMIGGADAADLVSSLDRATINADGSLGPFGIVAGAALKTPREGHRNLVIRNNLYVLGGDTQLVEQAAINGDGSLGALSTVGNALLINAHFEGTCTSLGGLLHVIGGDTSATFGDGRSEQALMTASGALSSFGVSPVGPLLRTGHSTLVLGNYLHILGGVDMNSIPLGPLSVPLEN